MLEITLLHSNQDLMSTLNNFQECAQITVILRVSVTHSLDNVNVTQDSLDQIVVKDNKETVQVTVMEKEHVTLIIPVLVQLDSMEPHVFHVAMDNQLPHVPIILHKYLTFAPTHHIMDKLLVIVNYIVKKEIVEPLLLQLQIQIQLLLTLIVHH